MRWKLAKLGSFEGTFEKGMRRRSIILFIVWWHGSFGAWCCHGLGCYGLCQGICLWHMRRDSGILHLSSSCHWNSTSSSRLGYTVRKILQIPTEELQHWFETEVPDTVKQPSIYARNFLEFCSYQALHLVTAHPDYLSDKEFRRLTYDMMLAWEAPSVENEPLNTEIASCSTQEMEGEDGWSLFYSSSTKTAVQVDNKKTVGPEAFARIAPACAVIADIITAHNLFDALTSSSSHRLHFLIYDKYLRMLEKVIKAVKNARGTQSASNLQLAEGEFILDVDGTVPIQPVLQHIGMSAWPGRLTLTNYALYFESLGVGLYEKAVRYDLAMDMKQVIRPDLTGPLGARLFDKAVMYKSTSTPEPVFLEFPEFKGNSRRDYWLHACLEILHVHRFIRKFNLKGIQQSEALARAILGIFRYRAAREAFQILSSHYKTLLCFNLAESLPGGDMILETLSSRLVLLNASTSQRGSVGLLSAKQGMKLPVSVLTLHRHGILGKRQDDDGEAIYAGVDVCAGEISTLETVVKTSQLNMGRTEAAQATVDQVKVEGIDTNLAVMKELLFPLVESFNRLQVLASWKDPWKSTAFLVSISYTIFSESAALICSLLLIWLGVILILLKPNGKANIPLSLSWIQSGPPLRAAHYQENNTYDYSSLDHGSLILIKKFRLLWPIGPITSKKMATVRLLNIVSLCVVPIVFDSLLSTLFWWTAMRLLERDSNSLNHQQSRATWGPDPAAPLPPYRSALAAFASGGYYSRGFDHGGRESGGGGHDFGHGGRGFGHDLGNHLVVIAEGSSSTPPMVTIPEDEYHRLTSMSSSSIVMFT
ncbi:hypothetical protein RHMOL_Rhmol12G0103000 [Rhododendron molle]|uniref:Uncharacterized protein n=1 Tax=Rhododendron molle TaxID=49168 RepID=A0ACC0LHG3_RHOML|nr:hypothetical protein RHMOL_Rhmol12G0103000 [Rhododendron molle]